MRSVERFKFTFILLILAAILGAGYFLLLRPVIVEKRQLENFEKQFFRARPETIKLIRIDSGRGPIDVVKTSSGWLVAGKYKGDEGAMERLLQVISQGRLIKIVGDGVERGKFGFDNPDIVISIGFADSRIDAIEIAGKNPAGTGHYAYVRSLGKVFLVNDDFAREMRLNLYELRDKRVFPFDPDEAYSLSVKGNRNDLKIIKDTKGWSMKGPFSARCDDMAVDGFLSSLSIHRAKGFLPWDKGYADLEKISLKVKDEKNSSLIDSDVYFWGSQGGRGVLIKSAGSDEAGRTGRDLWNMINMDPSTFLVRNLFDIDKTSVAKLVVTWNGNQYIYAKGEGGWTENGKQIESDLTDQLIDFLLSWKARKLVERNHAPGKEQMVIEMNGPTTSNKVIISSMNMDREVSPTGLVVPQGEDMENFRKVDFFLASSTALEMSPIVSSLDIDKIMNIIGEIERK